jgi:hypothetical protein
MENRVSSRVQRFTGSQGSGLWVAQVVQVVGLRRFGRRNTYPAGKHAGHRHWRSGFTGSRSLGHGLVGSGLRFRPKPPLVRRISLWPPDMEDRTSLGSRLIGSFPGFLSLGSWALFLGSNRSLPVTIVTGSLSPSPSSITPSLHLWSLYLSLFPLCSTLTLPISLSLSTPLILSLSLTLCIQERKN